MSVIKQKKVYCLVIVPHVSFSGGGPLLCLWSTIRGNKYTKELYAGRISQKEVYCLVSGALKPQSFFREAILSLFHNEATNNISLMSSTRAGWTRKWFTVWLGYSEPAHQGPGGGVDEIRHHREHDGRTYPTNRPHVLLPHQSISLVLVWFCDPQQLQKKTDNILYNPYYKRSSWFDNNRGVRGDQESFFYYSRNAKKL